MLAAGEHAFSPGLLARAHGGVLYVDEVNLLHDHLVDVLLDAAAMGGCIERDGVSHSHDARFVLIGTMNPERGAAPAIAGPVRSDRRRPGVPRRRRTHSVIRARMSYELIRPRSAPLRRQGGRTGRSASRPRERVADVVLGDDELRQIAALCAAFDVDGMRADLVV